jgi:predicted DNA-binding transcriptional regulator YafY
MRRCGRYRSASSRRIRNMTYQPTTRLLTVLELLQARGSIGGTELAERLEVDRRSVRRYIVSLQDLGIPIEGVPGPGGGYRLRPGHRMGPLLFTGPEAIATTLGLLSLRRGGPAVDPATLAGALAKVERVLPADLQATVEALDRTLQLGSSREGSRPPADIVATAARAVHERRRLDLTYRAGDGAETRREVDAYGVAVTLGHWYVVGWCHLRRGIRSFRLDRVVHLEMGSMTFVPPAGFDALDHVTRGIATMPARFLVEVAFDAPMDAVARRVSPAYARLESMAAGTLARYPADDLDMMAAYLVSLGLPFRVLAPTGLRDALRRLAERIASIADA